LCMVRDWRAPVNRGILNAATRPAFAGNRTGPVRRYSRWRWVALTQVGQLLNVSLLWAGLEAAKRKDGAAVARAKEAAMAAGGRVEAADKHDLNLLVDHRPHQARWAPCAGGAEEAARVSVCTVVGVVLPEQGLYLG